LPQNDHQIKEKKNNYFSEIEFFRASKVTDQWRKPTTSHQEIEYQQSIRDFNPG